MRLVSNSLFSGWRWDDVVALILIVVRVWHMRFRLAVLTIRKNLLSLLRRFLPLLGFPALVIVSGRGNNLFVSRWGVDDKPVALFRFSLAHCLTSAQRLATGVPFRRREKAPNHHTFVSYRLRPYTTSSGTRHVALLMRAA
jgi:hypothetical protein